MLSEENGKLTRSYSGEYVQKQEKPSGSFLLGQIAPVALETQESNEDDKPSSPLPAPISIIEVEESPKKGNSPVLYIKAISPLPVARESSPISNLEAEESPKKANSPVSFKNAISPLPVAPESSPISNIESPKKANSPVSYIKAISPSPQEFAQISNLEAVESLNTKDTAIVDIKSISPVPVAEDSQAAYILVTTIGEKLN